MSFLKTLFQINLIVSITFLWENFAFWVFTEHSTLFSEAFLEPSAHAPSTFNCFHRKKYHKHIENDHEACSPLTTCCTNHFVPQHSLTGPSYAPWAVSPSQTDPSNAPWMVSPWMVSPSQTDPSNAPWMVHGVTMDGVTNSLTGPSNAPWMVSPSQTDPSNAPWMVSPSQTDPSNAPWMVSPSQTDPSNAPWMVSPWTVSPTVWLALAMHHGWCHQQSDWP